MSPADYCSACGHAKTNGHPCSNCAGTPTVSSPTASTPKHYSGLRIFKLSSDGRSVVKLRPCGFKAVKGSQGCPAGASYLLLGKSGTPQFWLCQSHAARACADLKAKLVEDPFDTIRQQLLIDVLHQRLDSLEKGIADVKKLASFELGEPNLLNMPGPVWHPG